MKSSAELSLEGQIELLRLVVHRRTAELAALTVPPLLAWVHSRQTGQLSPLAGWAVLMFFLVLYLSWYRGRYSKDSKVLSRPQMLATWRNRIFRNSLGYGLLWMIPVALTVHAPSLEISTMLYLTYCAISAGAASYLSAELRAFGAFMVGIWVIAVAATPLMFPSLWHMVMPSTAIFCIISIAHGRATHRFVVRQISLEEEGRHLADQYLIARDEAKEALQEKNLFLSMASHDLRQPLHAMSMLVETIRLRNQQTDLKPMLTDLRASMNSMNLMFNSLLDLSKLESGVVTLNQMPVSLSQALREVAGLFKEEAAQRNLVLRLHVPRQEVAVVTDPALLRQVLVNLIHNALRYTVRGGVLLSLRKRSAVWQIETWDTGVGIADEEGARIFDPYYRNEQASRIDNAGHGLGLAVVARCTRLMGASHGYQSRLGRGSRFWVRLDGCTDVQPGLSPQASPEAHFENDAGALSGKCLVLDDDPNVLKAWRGLLSSWGLDARFAATGAQAMAHLDDGYSPDAVFCDQRLASGESGYDILRQILARCPGASGAIVSGEFQSPELAEADSEGYLILHKPLDIVQLHAVLSTWLPGAR